MILSDIHWAARMHYFDRALPDYLLVKVYCICHTTEMNSQRATDLYNILKSKGIVDAEGTIRLELLGAEVSVNDKSAIGNLIQEWLGQWMALNGVYFRPNVNTQAFPDFYLSEEDDVNLLEVKTFDYVQSPNFDIANFDAYVRSLRTNAYRLDADYLILGYSLSNGVIKINDIWLKKIWEITCPSGEYALRTQVKQGKIHNVRPYNFKSLSRGQQPFSGRTEFIKAVRDTLAKSRNDEVEANQWQSEVTASYADFIKAQRQ